MRTQGGWASNPGSKTSFTLRRASYLLYCSAIAVLKFLIILKQEGLHFHFELGPTNSVTGPALVSLGLFLNLLEPQFLHLQNGDSY